MAEIGLLASVLQVAGAGLKLSQTLYQYADSVASADRRVKDIATEVELTSRIIEELGTLFELQETSQLLSQNALNTANKTVRECSSVFTELDAALKKTKKNTLGRLMLPFRESKIELLRRHIDTLKSTLQLLLQVLVHAHQVAAQKLSRQAEAEQREQIKALLQTKKESAKKYEESLRNHSMSDDSTILDDSEQEDVEGPDETTKHNVLVTAALIGSNITVSKLEKCVLHIQGLLSDIEALQTALSKESDEAKHSDHHQKAMGSYLQAREHLDSIFLGNPQDSKTAASANEENHERIETGTGTSARSDQRATTTRYYIPPPPPMSSVPLHNSMNLPPPPPRPTNQKTLNVISGSSGSRQYQYKPGAYQGYRGSALPPPPAPPMLLPRRPVSPKILRPSSRSENRADIDSKTEMKHETGALGDKGLIGRFDASQTSNTETDTTSRRSDDGLLHLSPPSRYVADGLYWGPPPPPPLAPVIILQNTNPIPTSISSSIDNPMPSTNWAQAYRAGIKSSQLPLEAHEERRKEGEKREQLRLEAVKDGLRDRGKTNRVPDELHKMSEKEANSRGKEELEKKMQEEKPEKKLWYTGGRSSQSEDSATEAAAMATAAAAGPAGYYEPPDHREEGRMQDPTSSAAGKASSTERQSRYSFRKQRTQDDDDDEELLFQMSEAGADRVNPGNGDTKGEKKEKEKEHDEEDDPLLKEMMEGLAGEDSREESEEEPEVVTKDLLDCKSRTKGLTGEHNTSRKEAEDRAREGLKRKLQKEAARKMEQDSQTPWLHFGIPTVPPSLHDKIWTTTPTSVHPKPPSPRLKLAIPRSPHSQSPLEGRGLEPPTHIRTTSYEGRSRLKGLPPLEIGKSLSAGGSSDVSAYSRSMSFGEVQVKDSASPYQTTPTPDAQFLTGSIDASGGMMNEAAHRPGLGPLDKKNMGQKDAPNAFRKAAAASGAFRPRAGGAAAKLLAKDTKAFDEPDGISGVFVPPRQDLTPPRSEGLLSSHLQVSEQQHKQEGTTAYDGVMPVPVEGLQYNSLLRADPLNQRSSHYDLDSSSGYSLHVPGDYDNMLAHTFHGANRTRTSSNLSFIEPWSYPLHSPTSATSTLADVRLAVGSSALSTGADSPTSSAAAGFNDNAHKSQLNPAANPFQPSGSSESTLDQVSRSNRYVTELLNIR
jgi:hypothetical protein